MTMSSTMPNAMLQRAQGNLHGGGSVSDLCLLALDGGGVKGLSTLFILRRIMTRINAEREKNGTPPVKPCEVFDLIGGTSTGGLIAILLGRLEIGIDECITIYQNLIGAIFGHTKHLIPVKLSNGEIQNRFDPARLRAAIVSVLESKGIPLDEKYDNGVVRACHTFVVARRVENKKPIAIRDYTPSGEENNDQATIVEAALATSAASSFFPPAQIGARQYVDGALGSNNPVGMVWKEAQDLWDPEDGKIEPMLKCVLSIGTGRSNFSKVDTKVWGFLTKTLKDLVTETEETAQAFAFAHRGLFKPNQPRRYFRFNVDQGLEDVGLEEHKKVNIIEASTIDYLTLNQDRKFEVQTCGETLSTKECLYNDDFS